MSLAHGISAGRTIEADPPATLGSYSLLTKLAQGGMATVYLGTKQGVAGFERHVAIKVCHPHLQDDEEFVTMFLDEARLAARIHHPNVVPTLDVGHSDVLYLVMDYVEGDALVALLKRAAEQGSVLPVEIAVRVVSDALAGLHAAHELCGSDGERLNLVHRDVSPHNVLVGVDGVSRITDFGIAFAASRSTMTQDGRLKGKFSYMAPEQLTSQEATRRIDIFAAGIVLWEALTCRPLFRRKDDAGTLHAVLSAPVPPPSSIVRTVPRELDAVVLKALNRDPDQRFQTAAEFAEALERVPIEHASTRAVAAFVEGAIGNVLAERRALIREASGQAEASFVADSARSDVRPRLIRGVLEEPAPRSGGATSSLSPPQQAPIELPTAVLADLPAVLPQDMEHRRMRGLLAAAMLLLVGSAIGLLLAQSSPEPGAAPAQPAPPNAAPAGNPSRPAAPPKAAEPQK